MLLNVLLRDLLIPIWLVSDENEVIGDKQKQKLECRTFLHYG